MKVNLVAKSAQGVIATTTFDAKMTWTPLDMLDSVEGFFPVDVMQILFFDGSQHTTINPDATYRVLLGALERQQSQVNGLQPTLTTPTDHEGW